MEKVIPPLGRRIGKSAECFHRIGCGCFLGVELLAEHDGIGGVFERDRLTARATEEEIGGQQLAAMLLAASWRQVTKRRKKNDSPMLGGPLDLNLQPLWRGKAADEILAKSEWHTDGLGKGGKEVLSGCHGSFMNVE